MDHTGDGEAEGEEDVDEEIAAAAFHQKHGDGGAEEGQDERNKPATVGHLGALLEIGQLGELKKRNEFN